ncbi:uncharacterized protein K02A2.6-like [Uranotaenia lowii]|uniref:uncharacterized protein K02A2.6-like n=1 Tax=Uranotaenia lowii TaxID=190385 RepID=UPI0024785CDB|nr:uncharacterized protein K02A2.6-like [Uranotaenia lowii]
MTEMDIRNAILRLTDILANQQQQIAVLLQNNAVPQAGSEKIIESLATGIQEFRFDPDGGIFFDSWFARYEDVFRQDGQHLDDAAKVRLLLRKVDTQFHERYLDSILPSHPRDFDFETTVTKLKRLFGRQKSLFNARYQCLQYKKDDADDFTAYAASINKNCEAFQLNRLTSDQFKALRFVCGLQSPRDADIRTRLISKLEAEESAPPAEGCQLTLDKLVDECHKLINLKQDTQMVEKKDPSINALSLLPKPPGKKTIPKTPCWLCGDFHYVRECPFQNSTCGKCKRRGHKEGYCASADSRKKPTNEHHPNIRKMKGVTLVQKVDVSKRRKFADVYLNGVNVKLQLDCASDITIISTQTWKTIGKPTINQTNIVATSASGNMLDVLGEFSAQVTIRNVSKRACIYVTNHPDLNVLGIDLIDTFNLWSIPFDSLDGSISNFPLQPTFVAGDHVKAKIRQKSSVKWIPGRIIELKNGGKYTVLLDNGRLIRSHTNQLKAWFIEAAAPVPTPNLPLSVLLDDFV